MELLAIDAGNTHVKWAVFDGKRWGSRGRVPKGEDLAPLADAASRARRVCAGNVGGDGQRGRIEAALGNKECEWIEARESAAGVVSRYEPPGSLGFDRWCALLALRERHGGGVAVLAGTAVTVDPLSPDGAYEGGLILPGIRAMHKALDSTTGLGYHEPPEETAVPRPGSTSAAIAAGAVRAAAGAVLSLMADGGAHGTVVVSGGDANKVAALVAGSVVEPDLVFDGMAIAVES